MGSMKQAAQAEIWTGSLKTRMKEEIENMRKHFYRMAQPVLRRVKPALFTRFPEAGSQLPEDKAAFAALLHIG
ncbi:hypothetical protein D3C75_680330 [compost metagenome]